MAIDAVCPECDATYSLPNEQKGKKVRCKKCQAIFLVTGKASSSSSKTGIKRRDDDDDVRERVSDRSRSRRTPPPPARSSAPRRPRNEDDEDENEDDRFEGKSKAPLIIAAIVGVLILVGGGIGLVFALKDDKKDSSPTTTAQGPNPPANPPVLPVGDLGNPLLNPQGGNPNDPLGGKGVNPPPTNPPNNPPVTNPPANPPTNPPTNPPVNPPDKPAVNPPVTPPDKPADPPKNRERKDKLTPEEIKALERATVFIKVVMADGTRASGSGFFGSAEAPHIVLTNAHVVGMLSPDSRLPRQVAVIINSGQDDQREMPAKVLGVDRASDLAVLDVGSTTTGLPKPLTVRTASDLNRLDSLFVAGFPLGEALGKEITIRPSSVSSLRKKNGTLDKIQVNGGMDPGNSGGPVVNGNGEVVGVAVSGIPGRMINFAIPGERVHTILNGRLSAMGIGLPFIENGKYGIPVVMEMIDPRERIREVGMDVWTGDAPPGGRGGRPAADTKPADKPGDSPHEHVKLPYAQGKAEAEVMIPEPPPPGKVYWIQPNWTHIDGKTRWASASVYRFPSPAVERRPATLALRFTPNAMHTVTLNSTLTVKLSLDDDEDTFGERTMAQMTEQVTQTNNLGTWVKMRYQKVSQDQIVDKKIIPDPDLKQLMPFLPALTAILQYDGVGKLAQNTFQFNRALIRSLLVQRALAEFHEPIKQGLEAMSVPLPNAEVQPRATWQSLGRPLPIPRRKKQTGTIDMTYTYLGRRMRDGKEEAVIKIDGKVNSSDKKFGGKATGTALYDFSTGQITKANVSVTMDMDVQLPKSERSVRLVATVQVGLDRK